jgi:hypothetical protein
MSAYMIVYLILSAMSAVAVYAVATPVHRTTREQHELSDSLAGASG